MEVLREMARGSPGNRSLQRGAYTPSPLSRRLRGGLLLALPCASLSVLLACPKGPCSCTAKQCQFGTLTRSTNYCGVFLCFLLTAQAPGKFTGVI